MERKESLMDNQDKLNILTTISLRSMEKRIERLENLVEDLIDEVYLTTSTTYPDKESWQN